MKDWIQKYPREFVIGAFVFLGHLFCIFYNFKVVHPPLKTKSSIIVHTHTQAKPNSLPQARPLPKAKTHPQSSKPGSVNKKRTPTPKKKESHRILKDLETILTKIEQKQIASEITAPLTLPKKIHELSIDHLSEDSSIEGKSYLFLLVQALQNHLELPEEGNVRIQLTILKSGRVEKVQILYAESERNKHYLERELIHVTLPPFSDELTGKIKHTFILNFCHEK